MVSMPVVVRVFVQPIGVKVFFNPGILFDVVDGAAGEPETLGRTLANAFGANYIPEADGDQVLSVATSGNVERVKDRISEILRGFGYEFVFV